MPGTILENLSGRKLTLLISILLICQVVCFLIGGLIAPPPSNAERILASKCMDFGNNSEEWFYSRGIGSCEKIYGDYENIDHRMQANNIVFTFQFPLPRYNITHDYSRWQQNLIGVLEPEIIYQQESEMERRITLTLDARLGYKNKGEPVDAWKELATSSNERRILDCTVMVKRHGYFYNCSDIPLLELGSLHHDFYLLNIRLPVDNDKGTNKGLGHVTGLWLIAIHQNGGFTKVWVALKTAFFPIIIAILIWFWRRIHQLSRSPALLEYMLLYLGGALTLLNIPLEYLTLYVDMPFMVLLGDIRQGIFYSALLSFWLVFAGEHLMIQESAEQRSVKSYWKHLSAVATGCFSLLIFDICERGSQLVNPFYSVWVTELGTNFALSFIILAGISAGVYFIFLAYRIWEVFCNISAKRSVLPSMSSARRLHYQGIIYRFKFLMLATLLCAAITIVGFILGQVSEGQWKWDEDRQLEITSAFFTGVYGMWNIYIFALIVLYAPSHKQWPSETDVRGNNSEEIEFSRLATDPSEISSLASFARKSALD